MLERIDADVFSIPDAALQQELMGYHMQDQQAASLHRKLGEVANRGLPVGTINCILARHFPNWDYREEIVDNQPLSFLQRCVADPAADVPIPEPLAPRQSVYRNDAHVAIIIEDEVRGGDLRYLIRLEQRYRMQERKRQALRREQEASLMAKLSPEAQRFHEAQDVYINAGDPFTERQVIVLSLTTHSRSRKEIAQILHSSPSTISRLLDDARERVNVSSTGDEAFIELMMIAISLGIAPIDHIPEGRTAAIQEDKDKTDKQLLAGYYSPSGNTRATVRRWPKFLISAGWRRVPKRLGPDIKHQHAAVLCAIRDGLLPCPNPDAIKKQVARYVETSRKSTSQDA